MTELSVLRMQDLTLKDKRVLIREDLNVPLEDGVITSYARIDAAIPTIKLALDKGAAVLIASHLGRPNEGQFDAHLSLQPIAEALTERLGQTVQMKSDWLDGVSVSAGEVVLLENVRFNVGEKANDPNLAKQLAQLCDVFVMDAFGTAHRAHASTYGVAEYAKTACAGLLLSTELAALSAALDDPKSPFLAVVGGSKVSTKLTVLEKLTTVVDQLIVGGGIANTFIAAAGHNVGKSLHESDLIPKAQELMVAAKAAGGEIPIPTDVVVASEFSSNAAATIKPVDQVSDEEMILDIGPDSAQRYAQLAQSAGTVVWNGPLGVFEFDQFGEGTRILAEGIAGSSGYSIAGGGDTLAAVDKYGIHNEISYISTGGGAFLEFLEGKQLPALEILQKRKQQETA